MHFWQHVEAVVYRRVTMMKRSLCSLVVTVAGTLMMVGIVIILLYLRLAVEEGFTARLNFNVWDITPTHVGVVSNNVTDTKRLMDLVVELTNLSVIEFETADDARKWLIEQHKGEIGVGQRVGWVIELSENMSAHETPQYVLSVMHNGSFAVKNATSWEGALTAEYFTVQALWKMVFGGGDGLRVHVRQRRERMALGWAAKVAALLVVLASWYAIPSLGRQVIEDICGGARNYMFTCSLSPLCYWIGTFLVDFVLYFLVLILVWVLFVLRGVDGFVQNKVLLLIYYVSMAPGHILMYYCMVFGVADASKAPRQLFLFVFALVVVQSIYEMLRNDAFPAYWEEVVCSLVPCLQLYRQMCICGMLFGPLKPKFEDLITHGKIAFPHLVNSFTNVVLYSLILFLIEKYRVTLQRKKDRNDFSEYETFFKETKSRSPMSEETFAMERKVDEYIDACAVKISHVSRLFFDVEGNPVPAVNDVSLLVEHNSLFGFLGANGAGKTTLINMITGSIPVSSGTIEVNGRDVNEPKPLGSIAEISVCPQFNDHLCGELTAAEHLRLYSLIFGLEPTAAVHRTRKMMELLNLEEFKDVPIKDCSPGVARRLAIGLSFLGPADVILLDEPTASLDPIARHAVHELISFYKGSKTMMLCTHLLSEAESLCDVISIMIKGCLYTIDSPVGLTHKFGKTYRIDITLAKVDNASDLCHDFMNTHFDSPFCIVANENAVLYEISSNNVRLGDVFRIMDAGLSTGDHGFQHYTCCSSSLETVFLDICRRCESGLDVSRHLTQYAAIPSE